ncbi:Neutral endopeptidase [Planctomycetes bacterium CA13]|uniref:Neutral endopeptidase n=1 Tax=Novipirellula herctigrandis TaxID=2527986 RepID=A0A5C5Z3T9_9BACT|nr:Neutral endopeptidase [Planctomycetes bacterium CA13]
MPRFAVNFLSISTAFVLLSLVSKPADGQEGTTTKVSGIDKSLFGDTIDPGENFYEYANNKWLSTTKIPADKSDYGIFTILNDETREQVRELIEEVAKQQNDPGSAAQKVGDLYRSVMNTDSRNAAGITPINGLIKKINAIESKQDLAKVLGELGRNGVHGPIAAYIDVDAKDSDQYTVYITQTGLTLPDRDYYIEDQPRYIELRKQLKGYIGDMLAKLEPNGGPISDEEIESVYEIERQIAEAQWSKTENRDPEKTYNAISSEALGSKLDAFDWQAYAQTAGLIQQDELVIRQPTYLDAFAKLFASTDIDAWKTYLRFHLIDRYASSLTKDLEQRSFDFHGTAVSGISEQEPLWKRAVNTTSSVLGELVGQVYVERHFKPAAKNRMTELVENLKRAFAKRIESRDWMSAGTKKQALEKLTLFTTKIGYPDEWKDYSKLSIQSDNLASNLIAAANFEDQRALDKLGGPIDRNEWHMTPQTINAYYNPTMNEIVFPAAILQPPFFNMAADDAVNYGSIGAVIGHELSHGFDDKGSKYDGRGNLRSWWTPSDREEFERRAKILSDQYSTFEPVEGNFVNGDLTLGENIGDLGGLSVAYEAYQLSLDGKEADVIDGLTGDQRFFLGWSQIWRRLYRNQELLKRLITDPHSPSEYRVNGIVRNMDAWYEAFNIKPNDPLYLEPEERVRIW